MSKLLHGLKFMQRAEEAKKRDILQKEQQEEDRKEQVQEQEQQKQKQKQKQEQVSASAPKVAQRPSAVDNSSSSSSGDDDVDEEPIVVKSKRDVPDVTEMGFFAAVTSLSRGASPQSGRFSFGNFNPELERSGTGKPDDKKLSKKQNEKNKYVQDGAEKKPKQPKLSLSQRYGDSAPPPKHKNRERDRKRKSDGDSKEGKQHHKMKKQRYS